MKKEANNSKKNAQPNLTNKPEKEKKSIIRMKCQNK